MISTFRKFWQDESGPELVEWAVVTIILLVAAVILYIAVGRALGGVVCTIFCWINKVKTRGEQEAAAQGGACEDEDHQSCENPS
jgi:Flp pilus assembly pilin Flp